MAVREHIKPFHPESLKNFLMNKNIAQIAKIYRDQKNENWINTIVLGVRIKQKDFNVGQL